MGYAQYLGYLQGDPAWGGGLRRPPVSAEPAVVSHMGSQPHVPVVPTATSHVGSQLRGTTRECPQHIYHSHWFTIRPGHSLPPPPLPPHPRLDELFDPETANYDTILQIVPVALNRPDLYAQELRHPLSVSDFVTN